MANNIYIGMRYVPIYVGDYDSETVYEPLSIVAYNGASYTSKQSVPAGILPTNTTYWAKSSDFNAQYSELDSRITEAQDTADSAKEATDFNMQKNILSKCRFVIVGDSYAMGYNSTDGDVPENGWGRQIKTMLGLGETQYYEVSLGGAGFAAERTGGGYANMLTGLVASVADPDTIDYVVCCGGHNDISSNMSNVKTGIQNFYNVAHSNFPNARVMVGMIAWDKTAATQTNINNVLYNYMDGIRTRAPRIEYLNGVENSLFDIDNYIDVDGVHPTAAGNKAIAANIISAMSTGYAKVYGSLPLTITPSDGWAFTGGSSSRVACRFIDGNIHFVTLKTEISVTGDPVSVFGDGGFVDLATINGIPRASDSSNLPFFQDLIVLIRYLDSNDVGKFAYVPAMVGINNNKLRIGFNFINAEGNNWETKRITRIAFNSFAINYNMHM